MYMTRTQRKREIKRRIIIVISLSLLTFFIIMPQIDRFRGESRRILKEQKRTERIDEELKEAATDYFISNAKLDRIEKRLKEIELQEKYYSR